MDRKAQKHLSYANGYRQLGMFADAHSELAKIHPDFQEIKEVYVSSLAISSDEKDWEKVVELGRYLATTFPDEVEWWVQWAYALRRSDSVDAARDILESALVVFPVEPCLHYNLGCYACIDGELDLAKGWLTRAIELESDYKLMAMDDEDLVDLKGWLQGMEN